MNNEGLYTKIWGDSAWIFLHSITFNYPHNPSDDIKNKYKLFFETFPYVLPCCHCRNSSIEFINEGNTKLTDDVFKDRNSLTLWLYNLHNKVNKKLGVDFHITYEDLCKKYNSFISTTDMNILQKKNAFKLLYYPDCPFIPIEIASLFKNYAKKRNIDKFEETYTFFSNCSDKKLLHMRNKKCNQLIKKIHLIGNVFCEIDGEFKDLPNIFVLKLIKYLCFHENLQILIDFSKKITLFN